MQNNKKLDPPLQKFRPRGAQRLSDILKPDVLDDETRQHIMREVMAAGNNNNNNNSEASPVNLNSRQRPNQEGNHPAILRERVSSGNADLLSTMAQRLKTLEAQQNAYRLELREKAEKLSQVVLLYESEKVKREEAELALLELYNEREELEKQVTEMRKFLADYGLHWIGNDGDDDDDEIEESDKESQVKVLKDKATSSSDNNNNNISKSKPFELYDGNYSDQTPVISPIPTPRSKEDKNKNNNNTNNNSKLPFSIDVIKRHAQILSDHVGTKGVITDGKSGGIKEREIVRIVIYKDGICVNGGPFRPYGWPLCDAVINDLIEGYYPYEFKEKFPDGFPIEIIDQTSVKGLVHSNSNKDNSSDIADLKGIQKNGLQPISREEFIKRLPATRITPSGRIVSVQKEIMNMIGVHPEIDTVRHVSEAERKKVDNKIIEFSIGKNDISSDINNIPTTTTTTTTTNNNNNSSNVKNDVKSYRVQGLVALLLRFPSGQKLTLNLDPENTIADLRREIQLALPSFKEKYDIRLSFPAITFNDNGKTLRELGLLTSCTLMIQPQK